MLGGTPLPVERIPMPPTVADREVGASLLTHRNEVLLVGRVSADPEPKELPSGDPLVEFRLVVLRPDGHGRRRHDTLQCEVATGALRRAVGRWRAGDVVEVTGSVRRRFSKRNGTISIYIIEVSSAQRLQRAALA